MNTQTLELLGFNTIKSQLADLTVSNLGRQLAENLTPRTHLTAIGGTLRETTEARRLLEHAGSPPLSGLTNLDQLLDLVRVGSVLEPKALHQIKDFLRSCRKTREFMERRSAIAAQVTGYALQIATFVDLEAAIEQCIVEDLVSSEASVNLKKIRKELTRMQDKIKTKLHQIILSPEAKLFLQENVISFKDTRPVLMVKASQKHRVPGIVLGSSGSGGTLFVEPHAVHQLSNELQGLETAEQAEIYQILASLSGAVSDCLSALETNLEIMVQYDFAFAKARLSRMHNGIEPQINECGRINLIQARHPLLNVSPVPLDIQIGNDYRSLVITGPNTGGKTVTLKTVGLLTVMAQAGLHIPASSTSEIAIFHAILADIGDGQNLAQSLSTFSAHISNIIRIMEHCTPETLVLLDEIGTGTDPVEGAALAIAILEQIHQCGAITLASTHYPEIKQYALNTPGFKNGCMAFDRENLQPLYRLIIGQAGASQALWIAEKLGLPRHVLDSAKKHLPDSTPLPPSAEIAPQPTAAVDIVAIPQKFQPALKAKAELDNAIPPASVPQTAERPLQIGDLVKIPYLNEKGIVCTLPDSKGHIRVLIKDKKMDIAAKRVQLQITAEELYPENYDLNIVLLSKEERRVKHRMEKGKMHGVMRAVRPEEV